VLILFFALASCGGGGGGATPVQGTSNTQLTTVQGAVLDNMGQPVDNALVIVGTSSWSALTLPDGSFAIPDVPEGSHPIKAIKNGFGLGLISLISVSGASMNVGSIPLVAPPAGSPSMNNLRLDPSSGPNGSTITARVDVSDLGPNGTVILVSPELGKTWLMTLESGNTYKSVVTVSLRAGLISGRFFATAIDGSKAVFVGPFNFTITGSTSGGADISGVWKFYLDHPSSGRKIALVWFRQNSGGALETLSHYTIGPGIINNNSAAFDLGGQLGVFQGSIQGSSMEGTFGGSGTFRAVFLADGDNIPFLQGNGPVTLMTDSWFDLSTGTINSQGGDFQYIDSSSGISSLNGISSPLSWITENGFRLYLVYRPSLDSIVWGTNSGFLGYLATPCILWVKTAEGGYGIIWVSSASLGATFKYYYPY
jgi:hypothetical protein